MNFDIKQVNIETKLRTAAGDEAGTVKVKLCSGVGVGVGYRFDRSSVLGQLLSGLASS